MKTIKLYFLLISLLFCAIGCDRRNQPVEDLLTIEELEIKSEELSLYSVANYTLQDSLFFTREDGSTDGFVVNLVQSGRVGEVSADINESTGEITDYSFWEYGHNIQLENDFFRLLTGIWICQNDKYRGGMDFYYDDHFVMNIKFKVTKEDDKFSLVSSSGYSCIFEKNVGIIEFSDDSGHKWVLKEHKRNNK